MNAATPEQVRAAARRWLTGNALALESPAVPYHARFDQGRRGSDRIPKPKSFPDAPFPPLAQATLANGLRLIVAERHAVPVVQLSLQVDSGFAADQFAAPGVANLAMDMLDEGTTTQSALQINDRIASLGAELTTGANLDFAVVSLSALKDNLDASLGVYADVILNPAFRPEELERAKRLLLAENPRGEEHARADGAQDPAASLVRDGHAYSIPMTGSGTEQSVAAITRDDLAKFHSTWFKPNNATLVVVGDTTLAEIRPKLEALFARWQRGDVPKKALPNVDLPAKPRVFLIDRPGAEQTTIIAGHLVPAKEPDGEIAIDAMNDILGGAFTSRINMNLREDKTWAYGADTEIVDTQAQRTVPRARPGAGGQDGRGDGGDQARARRVRRHTTADGARGRDEQEWQHADSARALGDVALGRERHRGTRAFSSAGRLLEPICGTRRPLDCR
jgi:zinc protease